MSGTDELTAGSNARVVATAVVVSVPLRSPYLGYGPTPSWKTFHSPALTPSGGA